MADQLARAVSRFLTLCPSARSAHDLVTKQRVVLEGGYILDLYYNEGRNAYSYTLVKGSRRILGWDNAPHHPGLPSFPHHFHRADGTTVPSPLTGTPSDDIEVVADALNEYFAKDQ
jgi:hypothetical protein